MQIKCFSISGLHLSHKEIKFSPANHEITTDTKKISRYQYDTTTVLMPILSKHKESKTKSHLPGFFPLMSLILKQNMIQQVTKKTPPIFI